MGYICHNGRQVRSNGAVGERLTVARRGSDEADSTTTTDADDVVPGQLLLPDVGPAPDPPADAVEPDALAATESNLDVDATANQSDLDAVRREPVADAEPPREFIRPRPSRSAAPVDLIRPEPSLLTNRALLPHGQDRWVDHGLALLLRDRLLAESAAMGTAPPRRPAPAQDPAAPVRESPAGAESPVATAPERPAGTVDRRGADHRAPIRLAAGAPGRRPTPRDPALGLTLALLIGLVAAVVSWASVGPFWLANGVGTSGTATVTRCESRPLGEQCSARFVASDGSFQVGVRLAALDPPRRTPGAPVEARILRSDSEVAYATGVAGLRLRWLLGLGLVLGCGAAVGAATGVSRLRSEGPRRLAALWGLSFGGPLLLWFTLLLLALV